MLKTINIYCVVYSYTFHIAETHTHTYTLAYHSPLLDMNDAPEMT